MAQLNGHVGYKNSSPRDVLVVKILLNRYRAKFPGKAKFREQMSSTRGDESTFVDAIGEFQRAEKIKMTHSISPNDKTIQKLHQCVGESEAANTDWEYSNAGVEFLKSYLRYEIEMRKHLTRKEWEAGRWNRAKDAVFAFLSNVNGGLVAIDAGGKMMFHGESIVKLFRIMSDCWRRGLRFSAALKFLKNLYKMPAAARKIMINFWDSFKFTKLRKFVKSKAFKATGACFSIIFGALKSLEHMLKGEFGLAAGELVRTAFCFGFPPAAIFDAFEAIICWCGGYLKNTPVFRAIRGLNPGRAVKKCVDLLATLLHCGWKAIQLGDGNVNAALNELGARWEKMPNGTWLADLAGQTVAIIYDLVKDVFYDLFNAKEPLWIKDLVNYHLSRSLKETSVHLYSVA